MPLMEAVSDQRSADFKEGVMDNSGDDQYLLTISFSITTAGLALVREKSVTNGKGTKTTSPSPKRTSGMVTTALIIV